MMNTVTIREVSLTPEVLDLLIRLSVCWEEENSCYGYRRNEEEDIRGNQVFLAEIEGTVAGYLFGHRETTDKDTSIMPAGTETFEVEELYVCPEWRNQGLGRQLFSFVEQEVRGTAEYIMVSTATKNWRAILHFYIEELGMDFWSARLFKKV